MARTPVIHPLEAPIAPTGAEPVPPIPGGAGAHPAARAQVALLVLAAVGILYVGRPVILPVVLACVAGMTLKPIMRWSARCHIAPGLAAAIVLGFLVGGLGVGFVQLGRPAIVWFNEAPQHMAELRQRFRTLVPGAARLGEAADAVNSLGASAEQQKEEPTIELKTSRVPDLFNYTGAVVVGLGETVVLLYLILASGDFFLAKLVHLMPTLGDKKRVVEISHEIQQKISGYLLTVSMINLSLGILMSAGLYWLGVPNALMWGALVSVVNFVPYFGAILMIILLGTIGLLTFDTLLMGITPAAGYLVLHVLEADFVTPVMLGRQFTLNPVVIFVLLMFWTWLWGVPGALLSMPILVSIKVISDRVPSLSSLSALLDD